MAQAAAAIGGGIVVAFIVFVVLMGAFDEPPLADFDANVKIGSVPLTVSFQDRSDPGSNRITRWNWTFGNGDGCNGGSSSNEKNPTYTFNMPGKYAVELRVEDSKGKDDSVIKYDYITVLETDEYPYSPLASFWTLHTTGYAPMTAWFLDTSKAGKYPIEKWVWDFGDGTISEAPSPTHEFTSPGEYNVTLTVINNKQKANSYSSKITVKSTAVTVPDTMVPIAWFFPSTRSGKAPLTATFYNFSFSLLPIKSCEWTFGDGGTSTESSPTHVFNAQGNYDVTLKVTDIRDKIGTYMETINVSAGAVTPPPTGPTADFAAGVIAGKAPLSVPFADLSIKGDAAITNWAWDFNGDGGVDSSEVNPTYVYTVPGVYNVTLTVRDAGNLSDAVTKTNCVTVNAPRRAPTARFETRTTGLTVQFVDKSSTGDDPIRSWQWNFGDGDVSTDPEFTSHTYEEANSYTASLTVLNDNGSDTYEQVITLAKDGSVEFEEGYKANTGTLGVTPFLCEVPASGGEARFTVSIPEGTWLPSESPESGWLTLSTDGSSVVAACVANEGPVRRAVVAVRDDANPDNVSYVLVKQLGAVAEPITFAPPQGWIVAEGGPLSFTVAVPQGVTLTAASQDWISVLTPEPANNGGSATIEITCTANTSGTDRFGLVTVEGSDGSQGQLVVCQYEPEDPPIVVSPATAQVVAEGQTGVAFTVNVLEGVIWTAAVQTGGDWVTDLAETATSFTVNCAANIGAERTAEIVVTAGDYKALVAIVQAAGTPPIPPANAIQATPATRHILAAGGTASFSFTTTPADLAWTVSILWPPDVTADQMWLTLADDTTGIGSDSITVTAKPNETAATRRAGVKIADASGATYAVVEVEQFSLNEDKPVVVTPENATIASEGGALSLDVETLPVAVNWTADIMWPEGTEDAAKWATITAGASGAGTGAISITVQPNTGDVERKIPVRVTDANSNVVMAVLTQAGKSQPVEGEVNDNNTSGGGGACVGLNTGSHRSGGNTAIYAILAGALVLDTLLRRRKARNRR